MIKITDIVRAINKTLKAEYPNVTIQSTDVKEGYSRPCFYVDLTDFMGEFFMETYDHKRAAFSIYYFPTDPNNYRMELFEVRERLNDIFLGVLEVTETFKIHILDTEFAQNDGVLTCDFEVEYFQRKEDYEQYPYIEDMGIEI